MKPSLSILLLTVVLSACGRPDVVAEEERDAAALPVVDNSGPSPSGGPPANEADTAVTLTAPAETIPAALHGRWGLTPRDCAAPLGEALGLLVINSAELRFYESRAVPAADVQTSPDSISGDFAFTGEGRQWSKHLSLDLSDGELVRTERDPVVSFRYVRC